MRGAIAMLTIFMILLVGMGSAWGLTSGNKLYELLTSESLYSQYTGDSYILGVMDTTDSINKVWHLPVRWTIPPGVTKGQIYEAVKQYLEKHPEKRNDTAYGSVINALGEAFPPKK